MQATRHKLQTRRADGSNSLDAVAASAAPEAARTAPGIIACWSCAGPVGAGELFCPTCRAVQPPGVMDHFARLGLPVGFEIDPKALEQRYFDLQRRLHPDRFATRTARERALSQQQAVSLNEAYETLGDPLSRAVYLLKLKGLDVLSEGCNQIVDPVVLMEAMELREALEATHSVAQAELFAANAESNIDGCIADLADAFRRDDLDAASRLTTRLKYLRKLIEDARVHRANLAHGA